MVDQRVLRGDESQELALYPSNRRLLGDVDGQSSGGKKRGYAEV